jgi:multiple sugar transport system substrate-binding protein
MQMSITLKGMTWDHPRGFDPMVATSASFAQLHRDVQIVWEKRSLKGFEDHPLDELARGYDLIVIDHPHAGLVSRIGCLAPLDECGYDDALKTLETQSVGPSHRSYFYRGHQWGLAIDAATQVSSYRPDLIVNAPATWDEVIDLARTGRVLWPIRPVDALMSLLTALANRGTPWASDESPEPPDASTIEAALDPLIALARLVPKQCLELNPPKTYDLLASKDNEHFAYCPLGYGYSNYSRAGFRGHRLKFTDIPELHPGAGPRGSTIGGTGIAVSAHSTHRDLATEYAFHVASAPIQQTIYFDSGGQPGNAVAWEADRCNAPTLNFFRDTRRTLEAVYMRSRHEGWLDFQEHGGTIVTRCLAGEIESSSAARQLIDAYARSPEDLS